jgi:hypothetical protein
VQSTQCGEVADIIPGVRLRQPRHIRMTFEASQPFPPFFLLQTCIPVWCAGILWALALHTCLVCVSFIPVWCVGIMWALALHTCLVYTLHTCLVCGNPVGVGVAYLSGVCVFHTCLVCGNHVGVGVAYLSGVWLGVGPIYIDGSSC